MCPLWSTDWVFISQKTTFFIVTAVKASNVRIFLLLDCNCVIAFCYHKLRHIDLSLWCGKLHNLLHHFANQIRHPELYYRIRESLQQNLQSIESISVVSSIRSILILSLHHLISLDNLSQEVFLTPSPICSILASAVFVMRTQTLSKVLDIKMLNIIYLFY
jgi:hypothetical protein